MRLRGACSGRRLAEQPFKLRVLGELLVVEPRKARRALASASCLGDPGVVAAELLGGGIQPLLAGLAELPLGLAGSGQFLPALWIMVTAKTPSAETAAGSSATSSVAMACAIQKSAYDGAPGPTLSSSSSFRSSREPASLFRSPRTSPLTSGWERLSLALNETSS